MAETFVGHPSTNITLTVGNKSGAQEVVWAGDKLMTVNHGIR